MTTTRPIAHIELAVNPMFPTPLEKLRQDWQTFFEGQETLASSDGCDLVAAASATLSQSFGGKISIQIDNGILDFPVSTKDVEVRVHVFVLNTEEAVVEELEPDDSDDAWTAACDSIQLPHLSLHGLWESLIFEGQKLDLLEFAGSALLFAEKAVSGHIIQCNRLLLLFGPAGTGKTSLCRALAHKLAIRLGQSFPRANLLEIHSHSLFSKWFSTSGKLIHRLFEFVRDAAQDDPKCLVCVLIDEIESLASSRAALSSAGEPTDALRAVNSLLTSLDRLKTFPNVLILATTNLTLSVDEAFLDRADLKIYVGLPCLEARYEILRSCTEELVRVGIVEHTIDHLEPYKTAVEDSSRDVSADLLGHAEKAEGLSGRSLRRLPLQAHALFMRRETVSMDNYLEALGRAIHSELAAAEKIGSRPKGGTQKGKA